MDPIVNQIGDARAGAGGHAHLLVAEMAGRTAMESPAAVMDEVEYRANHISLLMEKMFAETMTHDEWEMDEG